MAALTAENTVLPKLHPVAGDDGLGMIIDYPVAASTAIYKGGLVGINTSGYLTRYVAQTVGTSVVGGIRIVGWALENIASQSTDGAKTCKVRASGMFTYALSGATIADVGKPVFASDDQTLTLAAPGNSYVGYIADYRSGQGVLVVLDCYKPQANTVARWSPIMAFTAANIVTVIPKSWNANGLYVYRAVGICTTNATDGVFVTLKDTAGTTLGITFTTSSTVANDKMVDVGSLQTAAGSAAQVLVPAGLGVNAEVTTTQAAGAGKFWVECIPGA